MSDYYVCPLNLNDPNTLLQVKALLFSEGIRLDSNIDYACGIYDENQNLIATGSCYDNTLRCFAVSHAHQGEGLLNLVISHLMRVQIEHGNTHFFVYTKTSSAVFFKTLGFYQIAELPGELVFLENQKNGFSNYLTVLSKTKVSGKKSCSIVMNANPFTKGHQYLVERAASENEIVHLFIVSEDNSLIPFSIRKRLVMEGTSHLSNIIYHDSGSYIISSATFPSYFQKDAESVILGHAHLDLYLFRQIAASLGVTSRYIGEEPRSLVTSLYNTIMKEELPKSGIACIEIPRLENNGTKISASNVRLAIKNDDFDQLHALVPECTFRYFTSAEAAPVITAIKSSDYVIHY